MPKWWATSWTTVMVTWRDDLVLGAAAGEDVLAEDRDAVGRAAADAVVGAPLA